MPINGALHQLSDADFDQTVVVEGTGDILLPGTEARIVAPVFSVHPESLRLAAYLAFYGMIALAGLVTYMWVPDDLSVSPLVQYFGYNNVRHHLPSCTRDRVCATIRASGWMCVRGRRSGADFD